MGLGGPKTFRCLNPVQQHTVVPRLGDEVEGTGPHTLNGQVYGSPRCHQDARHIGTEHLNLLQQRQPFLAICGIAVVHIHQHQLHGRHIPYNLHGCFGVVGQSHLVPIALQHQFQRESYAFIIINYEYHNLSLTSFIISRQRRRVILHGVILCAKIQILLQTTKQPDFYFKQDSPYSQ